MQSIILALLFMAVRAKQAQHSRVVILVPTNVQYNWMDELQQWLGYFTTAGVVRTDDHLALVRSCPAAWRTRCAWCQASSSNHTIRTVPGRRRYLIDRMWSCS